MKIKTGDKVKMLSGKDRGKTGKVLQVFSNDKKVVIEGLNLLIKHQRPRKQGEKGQRIQFPRTVDVSNIALICPKCNKATRVGFKVVVPKKGEKSDNGKKARKIKSRICLKCKEVI